jgi:heptosyltransferase I
MKIVIVKLSALGDIIHAMIILQLIKKYNKDIKIDWVVEEGYKELLKSHPDIDNVFVINLKKAKKKRSLFLLISELKKIRKIGSYDLVIDMQGLIKSALISRLIKSPITLGFNRFSIRESLASFFYNKTFNYGYEKNVIERNVALINFAFGLNITNQEIENKLPFLHPKNFFLNNNLSITKKNILLVPGASHKSKCYPVSKFAKFTSLIDANFLIIWGNKEEKILAEKIKTISSNVKICDKLSIEQLVSLISQVDLIIGPDTGPTHIGWALNVPSITLFGPTPGYRNTYVTKINQIIESNSEVNPFKIDKNDKSIKDIDIQQILKVTQNLLNHD